MPFRPLDCVEVAGAAQGEHVLDEPREKRIDMLPISAIKIIGRHRDGATDRAKKKRDGSQRMAGLRQAQRFDFANRINAQVHRAKLQAAPGCCNVHSSHCAWVELPFKATGVPGAPVPRVHSPSFCASPVWSQIRHSPSAAMSALVWAKSWPFITATKRLSAASHRPSNNSIAA